MSLAGLVGGYGSDDSDDSGDSVDAGKRGGEVDIGGRRDKEEGGGDSDSRGLTIGGKDSLKVSSKNNCSAKSGGGTDSDSSSGSSDSEESSEEEDHAARGKRKGRANRHRGGKERAFVGGSGKSNLLPSVDDLFSSTAGPDFLTAPGAGQDFVIKPMKKENKGKAAELSSSSAAATAAAAAGSNDPAVTASAKRERALAAGAGGVAVGAKKPKAGGVGPAGPPAMDSRKKGVGGKDKDGKDKVSAKDKVKGQRLKGQSGIGSDFRVWKSDLEMTMRQQYD